MEKRQSNRIDLEVPVQTSTEPGILRNISECGAYFITTGSYQTGEKISFSFELQHIVPEKSLLFCCLGHVTRMVQLGDKKGVATTIERYDCFY